MNHITPGFIPVIPFLCETIAKKKGIQGKMRKQDGNRESSPKSLNNPENYCNGIHNVESF